MRVISRLPPSSRRQLMATTQIEFAATALVRLPRRKMLANASRKPDTCPHKATRTRNAAPMAGDRPPKERRRAMPMIDLSFPLLGPLLPCDHGYELYAALSRILPALHHDELPCRIAPVRGTYAGDGLLQLYGPSSGQSKSQEHAKSPCGVIDFGSLPTCSRSCAQRRLASNRILADWCLTVLCLAVNIFLWAPGLYSMEARH